MNLSFAAGVGVLVLALTHFFADKLNLSHIPRSKWLSAAGGISVAYVFIHALPELKEWQEVAKESEVFKGMEFLEHHLYLIALFGLAFFYGLERAAKLSAASNRDARPDEEGHGINMFWVHMFSFGIYNFLIGYLLLYRNESTLQELIFFIIAMAFHFLVTDYGLLDHYHESYKKKGRWLIVAAIAGGFVTALIVEIKEAYIGMIFAFIAGDIILNILKEELPEERKSNYWAFLFGIAGYSALLLSV